jgi:hypothetical protein
MHEYRPSLICAHVCLRRDLNPVALRCVAYHGGKAPTSSAIRVTTLLNTHFLSTLSIGCNPLFVFLGNTLHICVTVVTQSSRPRSEFLKLTTIPDTVLPA